MNYLMQAACEAASGEEGWTPADLAAPGRVFAWWDYNDLSTLFQDAAGTTPVTAAGQSVGKVLDKSGNGFHWVFGGDPATRPILQTHESGNNYLDGDGVNDMLEFANSIFGSSFDGAMAFGFRPDDTSDGVMYANRSDVGNTINPQFDISSGLYRYALRDNAGTLSIATSTTAPNSSLNQILMGKRQSGVTSISIDGIEEDTDSTALGAVTEFEYTSLGSFSGSFFKAGHYYSMVVVAGAVTGEEEANIQNWTAEQAGRVLSAQILAIYADTGASGDMWDFADESKVTVDGSDQVTEIDGSLGDISLYPTTIAGPIYDAETSFARFYADGVERTLDPTSALCNLGDAFYVAAVGKYTDGFFRIVCVNSGEPHPVLFDIRIGEASASNPGGISALVQDAQANIANISGIPVPDPGELFIVTMKREAGGNATLKVNGVSGTVIKGAADGGLSAGTRFCEDYATTGHDFYLGRALCMCGAVPSEEQEAVIEEWLLAPYA